MAAQQKVLMQLKEGQFVQVYVELSVTVGSVSTGIYSTYTAFSVNGRSFASTPRVIGVNGINAYCSYAAIPTSVGVTLTARPRLENDVADAAVLVSATLEGQLA
jgi:hypothetical protein